MTLDVPNEVTRLVGRAPIRQVNELTNEKFGPITMPLATPMMPGRSPIDRGITVAMLCTGAQPTRMLYAAGTPQHSCAIFGYGIGTGTGNGMGIGVMQTSGKPRLMAGN